MVKSSSERDRTPEQQPPYGASSASQKRRTDRISKYVSFSQIEKHLSDGWLIDLRPLHYPHGNYAVMMHWICECQIPTQSPKA